MRITADVIDEEPCVECSDLEQDPPKCEKRLRLVVKGNPKTKPAKQYRFMFDTMLEKFKQLYVSDSSIPLNATAAANMKISKEKTRKTNAMAAKDSTSASTSQNADQEWLSEELAKMKKEITKEVTKNVLQHLMAALRNTQDSIAREVDESSVHKGIYCDNCDQIICGIRYKCGNCSDYDLCEVCENIPDVHDGNHIFLKIRNPMPQQSKPKRRRKKVTKIPPVYTSYGDMHLTLDLASSKTALGKLAMDRYKMNAKFLHDVTIPDGSYVAPGTQFLKIWKVMNSGNMPWTRETSVNYMSGSNLLKPMLRKLEVPKLQPGEEGVVHVVLRAPMIPGAYQSHWGFVHKDEETFGDRIWCMIRVMPYPSNPYPTLSLSAAQTKRTPLSLRSVEGISADDSSDDLYGGNFPVSEDNEAKVPTKEAKKEPVPDNKETLEEACVKQSDQNVNQVAEVLTAVHEVQERGEMVSRKLTAPSHTATPNNTPFDLSPPKSPEPQDPGSKDIPLGAVGVITSTTSTQGTQSSPPRSGGDNEDKVSTISLSSSESDAEFVVIPMPKCFALGDELSAEIVHPVTPDRDHQAGGVTDENVLVTSCQISKDTVAESDQCVAEPEETIPVEEPRNISIETTVKLVGNKSPDGSDSSIIVSQITVDCSSPDFSVIDSGGQTPVLAVHTPEVEVQSPRVESSSGLSHVEYQHVSEGETCDEHRESEPQREDGVPSDGTCPEEFQGSASEQTIAKQEERTIQVLPEGFVTGALSAAATVYNTARAVITSMQRSEQSQEGSECENTVAYIPAMDPMQQLVEMGFCNRPKNEMLLQKHNDDVASVVAELVNMNDNDWYVSRHSAGRGMAEFD